MGTIDGFWLPEDVRQRVLGAGTEYEMLSFARGRPCAPGDPGAVTARWPVLDMDQWQALRAALGANRQRVPRGEALWARFQAALARVAGRFGDPADPLHRLALASLPGYTGYSEAMIGLALGGMEMWSLEHFAGAFDLAPTREAAAGWQPLGTVPGRLRFYPARRRQRLAARLPGPKGRPLFGDLAQPEQVVGYGAGNVPGTALLIGFLALATGLTGGHPPATVVKNSRREPIFAPLVLGALEAADADLVAALAVTIWDYGQAEVQRYLLSEADLAIAAASDETIAQIGRAIAGSRQPDRVRFQAHGHKVSFSAIGREVLARGQRVEPGGADLIDAVALLAALDSAFWDQHGCLSSRVHFVEAGDPGAHSTREYAERLAAQLRLLADFFPRGAWPRRRLYDRFDRYKLLEQTGQVRVVSEYDDEFVVVVDERPPDRAGFPAQVNECEGRVIVVRPVAGLMEVPDRYLGQLPAANLQSLSVALGRPGEGLTEDFLRFAEACGARGVTALRTVGRGAFPQLAYSWDGLIPLDLVRSRPAGYFTTIEFDAPYDELAATYRLFVERGAALSSGA
ncbi:MAG: acyl-CoA reductase [Anaerolineae bacterium]